MSNDVDWPALQALFKTTDRETTLARLLSAPEHLTSADQLIAAFRNTVEHDDRDLYTLTRAVKTLDDPHAFQRLGYLATHYAPRETALVEAARIEVDGSKGFLHKADDSAFDDSWNLTVPTTLPEAAKGKKSGGKTTRSLKRGYTTGACATASSLACAQALKTGTAPKEVTITLPIGQTVTFPIEEIRQEGTGWFACVRKDAGDDPDVTHLALIGCHVEPRSDNKITFVAGNGIGTVTKPGLGLEVDGPAINPVPRKMMTEHITGVDLGHGVTITVTIPNGKELAKGTLNGRLGIIGGLSILGTTGIVKPFSTAAYRASIVQSIRLAAGQGREHLVLTTGGKSEKYAQKIHPELPDDAFIQMGDFVGAAVNSACSNGATTLTLCGMVGKISKIANRKSMTHAAGSEVNMELLAGFAIDCGANAATADKIRGANTARHVGELIGSAGIDGFYDRMCREAAEFVHGDLAKSALNINVICTDLADGHILGRHGIPS